MDPALDAIMIGVVLTFLALPTGWGLGVAIRAAHIRLQRKKWIRDGLVIHATCTIPDDLRPAEIAYLYDQVFGQQELLATLLDLDARGKARTVALPGKKADFSISNIDNTADDDLRPYEQEVLSILSKHRHGITWHQLRSDTDIWDSPIEQKLRSDLQARGYVTSDDQKIGSMVKYLIMGTITATASIALHLEIFEPAVLGGTHDDVAASGIQDDASLLTLVMLWFVASAVFSFAISMAVTAYGHSMEVNNNTGKPYTLWPRLESFREYLQLVERDQLRFEDDRLRTDTRNRTLPYATALNLSSRWEHRFSN